jgi:hypothetical protein
MIKLLKKIYQLPTLLDIDGQMVKGAGSTTTRMKYVQQTPTCSNHNTATNINRVMILPSSHSSILF